MLGREWHCICSIAYPKVIGFDYFTWSRMWHWRHSDVTKFDKYWQILLFIDYIFCTNDYRGNSTVWRDSPPKIDRIWRICYSITWSFNSSIKLSMMWYHTHRCYHCEINIWSPWIHKFTRSQRSLLSRDNSALSLP